MKSLIIFPLLLVFTSGLLAKNKSYRPNWGKINRHKKIIQNGLFESHPPKDFNKSLRFIFNTLKDPQFKKYCQKKIKDGDVVTYYAVKWLKKNLLESIDRFPLSLPAILYLKIINLYYVKSLSSL